MPLHTQSATTLQPVLGKLFQHIEQQQDEFVQRLAQWVSVESNSSVPEKWGEVRRLLDMTAKQITGMGGLVEFVDVGTEQVPSGETLSLPPVLLAYFPPDPKKVTLCVYGHVDIQPAKRADGWSTDPYALTEINGNLYGRGATDNKGPLLAWIHAIETYQATKQELPVNVKFIIEGMEEVGSNGLKELIQQRSSSFFSDVDFITISDNVWLSDKPCLTYGTRGSSYFFVEVEGPKLDLHSGVFGGSVHEPMTDLIALLASLVDQRGKILVPGVNEAVAPVTPEERERYEELTVDLDDMKKAIGVNRFLQDSKEEVLMARWRYPALSIHGIEGAFCQPGSKTVIPKHVIGKFSIRQVPNMEPAVVERQVTEHLHHDFAQRNSPNSLKVTARVGAAPWVADLNDLQYVAAGKAVEAAFGMEPELIREGSTIPIAHTFQAVTGKSVMMLPIGGHDDGEHSQNEKISRSNFIKGTKLFAAYFLELALLH